MNMTSPIGISGAYRTYVQSCAQRSTELVKRHAVKAYVELQMLVLGLVKPANRFRKSRYLLLGLFSGPEVLDVSNVGLIVNGALRNFEIQH